MTTENHAMRIGFLPKWPRSAYSASAPVTHSTIAPSRMKLVPGLSQMNFSAYQGFSALMISGWCAICHTPSTAMAANQASVTGPKNLPMPAVPRFCTANRQNSTTSVIGIT
ncbi:hypothetical protein D3C87_780360 [compost metagenome]